MIFNEKHKLIVIMFNIKTYFEIKFWNQLYHKIDNFWISNYSSKSCKTINSILIIED